MRGGYTVGLTMRVELSETQMDVAVEASNIARTFVVVLDSLQRDLLSVLLVKIPGI